MEFGLQLRSLIRSSGELELSLVRVTTPEPADDEIIVRVEASPINPSDLGLLLGAAEIKSATAAGEGSDAVVTAPVPPSMMKAMAARLNKSLPVGNEGAGIVVRAGRSESAQALLGKAVGMVGGAMYAQYRCIKAESCLVLPEGTAPAQGASWFINPLTSLGMVETMRREGHTALVHTAAASNLGQMLNKVCRNDGIGLVNVVRDAQQEELLRSLGATHVCISTAPTFFDDLTRAVAATGATIAFDAIGGGSLAGQILASMETAINMTANGYSRYGSTVHKQVYLYGDLDTRPTEISRGFGVAWGCGGWLLSSFLQKIGSADAKRLRARVAAELKTTFASKYSRVISLEEALQLDAIAAYTRRATGQKYLINPNKS
jgi:NADPH:quinone reductase-like Zn-dependent oxidoreductase